MTVINYYKIPKEIETKILKKLKNKDKIKLIKDNYTLVNNKLYILKDKIDEDTKHKILKIFRFIYNITKNKLNDAGREISRFFQAMYFLNKKGQLNKKIIKAHWGGEHTINLLNYIIEYEPEKGGNPKVLKELSKFLKSANSIDSSPQPF